MDKSRLELKVGLFVFIGLALLAALLIQFSKSTSLWRGTYELRLHAANVGGIKPRAGVLLAGVQVGSVSQIDLAQNGKSVTMILKIYKDYPIYGDARFVIEQSGFLGDQFVSVIPTTNALPALTNNADVPCEAPFNLQEVARGAAGFVVRLDDTAKKLDAAVTDLREQVLNAQTLASFGTSITNLKLFTEQALDTVQNINGIVATNGGNINAATKDLADASSAFKQLAADLQAGKGLAGAVLQNPELATNVQSLAANLAVTSSNLNRLGLWGILWSHKPPKTGSITSQPDRAHP
jgi:phospholipid/cholesterol/gamma-HCH transport system substrate-binding protein